MTREAWIVGIKASIHPVGECMEWDGPYMGTTPLVYCPRDFAWSGQSQSRQSLRVVLFALSSGHRPPRDGVIRTRCQNFRCVHEDHFIQLTRKTQSTEQSARGEFDTPRARAAKLRAGRKRSRITQEVAEEIRTSTLSSKEVAAKHNVSRSTVNDIRRGDIWAPAIRGSSVFNPNWAK